MGAAQRAFLSTAATIVALLARLCTASEGAPPHAPPPLLLARLWTAKQGVGGAARDGHTIAAAIGHAVGNLARLWTAQEGGAARDGHTIAAAIGHAVGNLARLWTAQEGGTARDGHTIAAAIGHAVGNNDSRSASTTAAEGSAAAVVIGIPQSRGLNIHSSAK